jgi:hypothetical protein
MVQIIREGARLGRRRHEPQASLALAHMLARLPRATRGQQGGAYCIAVLHSGLLSPCARTHMDTRV